MQLFTPLLKGSYGYLLIFQVLVISSLVLMLIWLIAQRIKAAASIESIDAKSGVDEGVHAELKGKFAELEAEYESLRAQGDTVKPLQEKVRFLESKLLEYEILQEEIGTLGTLKMENEKLKSQLLRAEKELNSATTAPTPNISLPVAAAIAVEPVTTESPLAQEVLAETPEIEAVPRGVTAEEPPPAVGGEGLDDLLSKIGDLGKA